MGKKDQGHGAGFAVGAALGAAAALLFAPAKGKRTRAKVKKKTDELIGGRTPEEIVKDVQKVVKQVVKDAQDAVDAGKTEAGRTKEDVIKKGTPGARRRPRKSKR